MEFEVSFRETLRELAAAKVALNQFASDLDKTTATASGLSSATSRAAKQVGSQFEALRQYIEKNKLLTEEQKRHIDSAERAANKMFESMITGNARATAKTAALTGALGDLDRIVKDTAAKQAFNRWLERGTALTADSAGKVEFYRLKLKDLHTEEGIAAVQTATLANERTKEIREATKAALAASRLADAHVLAYQKTAEAQKAATQQASNYRAIIDHLINAEREMAVTGQKLAWGYDVLTAKQAELTAQQQRAKTSVDAQNKAMVEGVNNVHNYTAANAAAARAAGQLADAESRSSARRKETLSELKNAILLREQWAAKEKTAANAVAQATRLIGESEAMTRTERARSVAGAQAYNQAMLKNAEALRISSAAGRLYTAAIARLSSQIQEGGIDKLNQQLTNLSRYGKDATSSLRLLTDAEAKQAAEEEKLARLIKQRNDQTQAVAASTQRLTQEEANQIARTERLKRSTEDHNKRLLEQARASLGLIDVKRELNRNYQTSQEKLDRLRAYANLLTTSYGQQTAALERQIKEQKEYNRLLTMSTAELLGFSNANKRLNGGFNASAQAAAMLRAGVTGLHASFGMYTSATILAATATYAFTSALRDAVSTGIDFTGNIQRSEAVMMTSAETYRNVTLEMNALESQVRALGATTSFTGSEVAKGLVDLGMAGLSSTEALSALEPTLRLAAVGVIDMGQAADIATNVMTAFDQTASDLTDVVDVMATAVTNSNTSIGQLANALTYVGPAANAAGFELRDTVAAIELLSNAGIKGSKAGTGLRRFMLNIQNPTKKGRDVLDQFGIAITNVDGSTRTLTDILGQFHDALYNDAINPAERTAAVMDLVGVRAQSAVSRLIGSAGEFSTLRNQLDNVTGAAERMRLVIEDYAGGDLKKLNSAFEEIKLTAFEKFEPVIRRATMELTVFLQSLNEPVSPDSMMTRLDEYIADFMRFGEAALALTGTFVGFKVLSGTSVMLGAFSDATRKASNVTSVLSARYAGLSATSGVLQTQMRAASITTNLSAASFTGLTAAAGGAGAAVSGLSARISTLMMIASRSVVFLGWAGALAGIGYAIYSAFGRDNQERVESYNQLIDESVQAHKNLEEQADRTAQAMKIGAMEQQATAVRSNISSLVSLAATYRSAMSTMDEDSEAYRIATERLNGLEAQTQSYQTQLFELNDAINNSDASVESVQYLTDQQDQLAQQISETRQELEGVREEYNALLGMPNKDFELDKLRSEMNRLNGKIRESSEEFSRLGQEIDTAAGKLTNFAEDAIAAFDTAYRASRLELFTENMSTADGLRAVKAQRARSEEILRIMQAAHNAGQDTYTTPYNPNPQRLSNEAITAEEARLAELGERLAELEYEQGEHVEDVNEAYRERELLLMSAAERTAALRQELSRLQEEERQIDPLDQELLAENVQRQNEITQELQRSNKEATEYTSKLEKHRSLLEEINQLRGSFDDAVTSSASEVAALQAQNDLLYDNYETEEQRLGLVDTLLSRQREANVLYENMAERQVKIREQQERINELQAATEGKTGKERRDAEEAVSKALQAQRDLVKEQVTDQIALITAAKERVIEVEGQVAQLEQQRNLIELTREAAAQGQAISLQEAERLQGIEAINLALLDQQDALYDAQVAAEGLSGQALEANEEHRRYLQESIALLERRKELENDPATQAAELLDTYDSQYQKLLQLQEAEQKLIELRDEASSQEETERYGKALENLRKEMDELALSSENFGERMGDALRMVVEALNDDALSFEEKMTKGARGTAELANGLRQMGQEGTAAFHALTIATDLQNLSAAVGAIVNQGFGDPYTAFGRMAAMAAAVTSLGFNIGNAFSGGGMTSEEASQRTREENTFGTVLGEAEAASKSIENAVEITADATSELVGINRSMLEALQNVQEGISGAVTLIARDTTMPEMGGQQINTNFNDQIVEWVDKIPLIGDLFSGAFDFFSDLPGMDLIGGLVGGKAKQLDDGIIIDGGAIQDVINNTVVNAYTEWKEKKNIFDDYDTKRRTERVDASVERQFGLVFESLYDSVAAGVENLGMLPADVENKLNSFVLETTEISLDGLDTEEQKQHINDVFSRTFDQMAEQITPFLTEMQKAGEGLGETLARVSTQVQVGEEAVSRLGFGFSLDTEATAARIAEQMRSSLESQLSAINSEISAKQEELNQLRTEDRSGSVADMLRRMRAVPEVSARIDELSKAAQGLNASLAEVDFNAQQQAIRETAEAFEYLVEASGGLEEFVQGMNEALSNFASEAYQFQVLTSDMNRALAQQSLTLPQTRDGYWELIQAQDGATQAGADNIATLLRLQEAADEYYSKLESLEESYRDRFYSETERSSLAVKEMAKDFAELGIRVPASDQAFKALVEAQDRSTEAGKELYAQLLGLSEGFVGVGAAITQVYEDALGREPDESGLNDWVSQVLNGSITLEDALSRISNSVEATQYAITNAYEEALGRKPDASGLEYWMSQVESGAVTLSEALYLIRNSAEAAEYAASGAAGSISDMSEALERQSQLQDTLFNLQASTAEKRARDLEQLRELDPEGKANLVSLQERIWAIEDEKQALDDTLRTIEKVQRAREAQLNAETQAVETLARLYNSLQLSTQSILNPLEQMTEAQRQFAELQVRAENGDTDAVSDLAGASTAYLDYAAAYYGQSSEQYARIFNDVNDSVQDLESQFKDSVSELELIERALNHAAQEAKSAHLETIDFLDALLDGLNWLPEALGDELSVLVSALSKPAPDYSSGGSSSPSSGSGSLGAPGRGNSDAYDHESGVSVNVGDTAKVLAAKVFYQSARGGVSSSQFNKAMSLIGATSHSDFAKKIGYNGNPEELREKYKFASGGAFTNGVVDRPTKFNMAEMGEVGPEAIMPLANIGGKLGVNVAGSVNLEPMIRELQALRQEVAMLRAERRNDAERAAGQRSEQVREARKGTRNSRQRRSTV